MKKKRTKNSLRRRIRELEYELEQEKNDRECAERRLMAAGMDDRIKYDKEKTKGTEHVTAAVNVQAIPYGNYMVLAADMAKETDLEERKQFLVNGLVEDLIRRNMVRFIYRAPDMLFDPLRRFGTLAARLDVVPWEQLIKKEDK